MRGDTTAGMACYVVDKWCRGEDVPWITPSERKRLRIMVIEAIETAIEKERARVS